MRRKPANQIMPTKSFLPTFLAYFSPGSFLEAKLNELSAEMVTHESGEPKAPLAFWKTVHDLRKDLGWKDKWNLIASASNGKVWDSSCDPFQSYDLINSLRNELVHYKAEYAAVSEPRVKKINDLLQRFAEPEFATFAFPGQPDWVSRLLPSKKLGAWISETVDHFDMKFDHYLSGTEFTDTDQTVYQLRNAPHHDPFRMQ
jgi:hypothetical protein